MIGDSIHQALDSFRSKRGLHISKKSDCEYLIKYNDVRIKIITDVSKELSAEFTLVDRQGNEILSYRVDPDTYDISDPDYSDLAQSVEEDIAALLEGIGNHEILISKRTDGRTSMIFPKKEGYALVKEGRWLVSSKTLKNLDNINAENFRPLLG